MNYEHKKARKARENWASVLTQPGYLPMVVWIRCKYVLTTMTLCLAADIGTRFCSAKANIGIGSAAHVASMPEDVFPLAIGSGIAVADRPGLATVSGERPLLHSSRGTDDEALKEEDELYDQLNPWNADGL
jgi:hypothetical protein